MRQIGQHGPISSSLTVPKLRARMSKENGWTFHLSEFRKQFGRQPGEARASFEGRLRQAARAAWWATFSVDFGQALASHEPLQIAAVITMATISLWMLACLLARVLSDSLRMTCNWLPAAERVVSRKSSVHVSNVGRARKTTLVE